MPEVDFPVEVCLVDENTGECLEDRIIFESIRERRAPVILIHGLWANNNSWEKDWKSPDSESMRERLAGASFAVSFFNYQNDLGPSETMKSDETQLSTNIQISCAQMNLQGFACTRADIVAHSMGGLVARKFIHDNQDFKHPKNFMQGFLRRLVTIGTPHLGSGLANLIRKDNDAINSCIDDDFGYDTFIWLMSKLNGVDAGDLVSQQALDDLSIGSNLVESLNFQEQLVTTFGIIGDTEETFQGPDAMFTQTGCTHSDIFQGGHSDGIVSVESQQGNLGNNFVQIFQEVPHASAPGYTGETRNSGIINRVIELLNSPKSDFSDIVWDKYVPDSSFGEEGEAKKQEGRDFNLLSKLSTIIGKLFGVSEAYAQDGVAEIVLSSNLAVATPGDEVVFEATVVGGDDIRNVSLIDLGDAFWVSEDFEAPYEWEFPLSNEASGNISVQAIAQVDGEMVESNVVTITIQPDLTQLTDLTFIPSDPVVLFPGMSKQLQVRGIFSDGFNRYVTTKEMGTVYSENLVNGLRIIPGDSPVIRISESGELLALVPGEAEVVATNSGYSSVLRVVVQNDADDDFCPDDPAKNEPGICGCGVVDTDSDADDAPDCVDECPADENKIFRGACGCGQPETDTDGDGTPDCIDNCPNDPSKTEPGCGCGVPDTDSDNDGTPDCNDPCPNDPSNTCKDDQYVDYDTDGDGTVDSMDGCYNDPNKTEPGVCGCGVPETDTDGDGTPDCSDNCLNDPNKTEPGVCGCGVPETDTDGDGTPDCNDNCPNDPNKTEPGVCGCGVADTDTDSDGTLD